MNRAEQFVTRLCEGTFLSLWSYPNPRKKDSEKELCDLLVVCAPDIVIFSVKDVSFKDTGRTSVDWDRWHREAIEKSISQIFGAERYLNRNVIDTVITKEGKDGLPIPNSGNRKIHRVAVALGSQGKAPVYSGDFDKGFVHVFDEISFETIIKELDTITDFLRHLESKEDFLGRTKVVMEGGEGDLLAIYISNGRSFPKDKDMIIVADDCWKGFSQSQEYKDKKKEDEISYSWDQLIENISGYFKSGTLQYGNKPEAEVVIRIMAREDRFSRRILAKNFWDFMRLASKGEVRSRAKPSKSGISYVFLACPHGEDRKYRQAELGCRCCIVRGMYPDNKIVVGIATEKYVKGKGFSFGLVYFHRDNWSNEDRVKVEEIKKETGFFSNVREIRFGEDEYPKRPR